MMKKEERLKRIVKSAKSFPLGYARLDYNCENRNCNARCVTCPVMAAKKDLCKKFGVELPEADKMMLEPIAPKVNLTINGNVTINVYGKATIRWIER